MSPLLPPNSTLKTNEDFPDVCLASNFRPNAGTLSMNSCGRQMSTNITGTISLVKKSYYFAAFSNETMDYCMADGTFSNHRNIDICEIIHPGNATVNFYLLVMNAVRVVFTKVVVFSTILTIKVLVH